jgi:ATP-dependent Clp protease protease subunit
MKRPETRREAMATLERAHAVLLPNVVETTHRGERTWNLFDRLLRDRIVMLGQEIDDTLANVVVAQLLFLEAEDPDKDITLYVSSPGGSVYAGLAIYDTMTYVRPPVGTLCVGLAASMAAVLLAAGEPGKRVSLPSSRILLHQPHGGARGQVSDIEIQAREARHSKDTLVEILAKATGKSHEVLVSALDRDLYLGAEEARDYGLIDQVLVRRS